MSLLSRASYDDDHEAFRDSVRRFLADEVVAALDEWRAAGRFGNALVPSAGVQGFLGTGVPEDLGGGGVDDPRFVAVMVEEAMAVGAAGLALVLARHSGVCVSALLRAKAGATRDSWLSGLADGSLLAVPAVLDDSFRALCVPGAAVADLFVLVLPGPDQTVVVVPREHVELAPVVGLLGGREAGAADVVVDRAVLADGLEISDAGKTVRRDLDVWSAVCAVAGAEAALDLTMAYVQERKVFGKPVAEFENTRFRLAELGSEVLAADALTSYCVAQLGHGGPTGAEAAAARLMSGRVHDQAVDQGMQLHGGYGYMREYPISHAFADARFLRQAAGAGAGARVAVAIALGL
jgi:acyl-CoA dehydrogenase